MEFIAALDIWADKYILDFQLAKHCFAILATVTDIVPAKLPEISV